MQPHAPELEEAVIGACLIEQEALPLIADKLRPEMFYDDHHQLIFAALMAMYHAGKKIDILTVKEELARRGNLDAIGGPYAIVQLSSKVASSAHIEYQPAPSPGFHHSGTYSPARRYRCPPKKSSTDRFPQQR